MHSICFHRLAFLLVLWFAHSWAAQSAPALDSNFAPVVTRPGGFVTAVAAQPNGKVIVAGGFSAIQGKARLGLARLNADGSLDSSFDPGTSACCGGSGGFRGEWTSPITALAVQGDGKILIGGLFTSFRGGARQGLARLNADGTLDSSFNPGAGLTLTGSRNAAPVAFILVQPDGRIVVGGQFTAIQGVSRNGIARFNASGALDDTFDPGTGVMIEAGESITSGMLLPSGKILVAGTFAAFNENNRFSMARLNSNGSVDTAFDPPVYLVERERGPQSINGFAVQPDGKIVISGVFDLLDSSNVWDLGRLNADGTADPSFAGSLNVPSGESFQVLGATSDGKILGFHSFNDAAGNPRRTLARWISNGTPDPSFTPLDLDPGENSRLRVAAVMTQPDGKVWIGGHFAAARDRAVAGLARLGVSGGLDAAFRPGIEMAEAGAVEIQALAVQRDGRVLLGGTFSLVNGVPKERLARLTVDGRLDASFITTLGVDDANSSVSAIEVLNDGKIYIGGNFRTVNGISRNGLARLNEDGSLDSSFQVGTGTNEKGLTGFDAIGRVNAVAVDTNRFVWIAGDFVMYGGVRIPYIARLNESGVLDPGFNMGFRLCDTCDVPTIRTLAPMEDGSMLVGGSIERIGVAISPNLVRVRVDGNLDPSFSGQLALGEEVLAFGQGADGKTVAAVGGATDGEGYRGRLVQFASDGSALPDFKPETMSSASGTSAPASAAVLDSVGRTIVAGGLSRVGGTARAGLARLGVDGMVDSEFHIASGFLGGIFEAVSSRAAVVTGLEIQSDGGLVVSGHFATASGEVRLGLARFLTDSRPSQSSGGGNSSGNRPQLLSPARAPDGAFTFLVAGEAGKSYRIEVSVDLVGWSSTGVVVGTTQPTLYRDAGAPGPNGRYYRAVAVP